MDKDLSLFGELNFSETLEKGEIQTNEAQQSLLESREKVLDKMQFDDLEELVMGSVQEEEKTVEEVEKKPLKTYQKEEIFQEVVDYFNGDELAAGVWIDKYALKNDEGQLMERNPDEMHRRLAREFARIENDGTIRTRVWERGSGITQACGTGACATAVAAALTGKAGRQSTIVMDGGALTIEWRQADNHVYMTGPATFVYDGEIKL